MRLIIQGHAAHVPEARLWNAFKSCDYGYTHCPPSLQLGQKVDDPMVVCQTMPTLFRCPGWATSYFYSPAGYRGLLKLQPY